MTVKHKCSGKTWSDIGHNRIYQCSRNATVERGGKWYCWQHDPIRVEADKKKRRAADKAKMDRYTARWARRARNAKLAALVTEETAALLERLASNISVSTVIESKDVARLWRRDTDAARALAARIREALKEPGK